jgi:hypothetical protein
MPYLWSNGWSAENVTVSAILSVQGPLSEPGSGQQHHTGFLPCAQPTPASRATPAAELFREEPPEAPGAKHEDDPAEGGTVGNSGEAALELARLVAHSGSMASQRSSEASDSLMANAGYSPSQHGLKHALMTTGNSHFAWPILSPVFGGPCTLWVAVER